MAPRVPPRVLPRVLPRRRWEPTVLEIPAIHVRARIQKGVGNWWKIPGPAYEVWSAGPGGAGNAVIAAHRNVGDEIFMTLPEVRPGDSIYLVTKEHRYKYVVDWSHPVEIATSDALDETKAPSLTLYTCVLPFNAKRRYVVRAHLAE